MNLDLSPEEHKALTKFLCAEVDADKSPLSPRLEPIKSALAKLDPPKEIAARTTLPEAPMRSRGSGRAGR